MFGPRGLDLLNTYVPDLSNIDESIRRTLGEADSFYRKEDLYLKDVEKRIKTGKLYAEEEIYDETHAIASDLAKCCEMYLKALYLYEHNVPEESIRTLWDTLKTSDYLTDAKGNRIYETPSGIITYPQYDENGDIVIGSNGQAVYIDANGNKYDDNSRGRKIKRSGHQLDRLIELLSPATRLLLELRISNIPMSSTEEHNSVSILDILSEKGLIDLEKQITQEQFTGWIDQHKRTFEEARYSGELKTEVSVEFLYHLATQLKAVAHYRIKPKKEQQFTVTEQELQQLPDEIKQLASFHSHLISEDLIKLIANNPGIKEKIVLLFSNDYTLPNNISQENFYKMVKLMSKDEILYVSYLMYMIENYQDMKGLQDKENTPESVKTILKIAEVFAGTDTISTELLELLIETKEIYGDRKTIDEKSLLILAYLVKRDYNEQNKRYSKNENKYEINNEDSTKKDFGPKK